MPIILLNNICLGNEYEIDKVFHQGEFSHYVFGKDDKDNIVSPRDYLLYCYIFAVRDSNIRAASEFVKEYMRSVDKGRAKLDMPMLKTIEELSRIVLSDTSESNKLPKFFVATTLNNI